MKTYGTRIETFDCGRWGTARFAQWLHPGEQHKDFDEALVSHYARFIPPGSLAIDVGAFTGDTALPMVMAAGRNGTVLAFEPGPATFPVLLLNAALTPGIVPVNLAVSNFDGPVRIYYVDEDLINGGILAGLEHSALTNNTHPVECRAIRLAEFLRETFNSLLPRLAFIKIDTEGHDVSILHDIADLLAEFHPAFQIEIYPYWSQRERQAAWDEIAVLNYLPINLDHAGFFQPGVVDAICRPKI